MSDIKKQRDRFLAFAFASADLLIEIDKSQKIIFASGAAKKFFGETSGELIGRKWLDLFHKTETAMVTNMRKQAQFGKRCGPVLVNLPEGSGDLKNALITALKMPDYPENFFFTITQASITAGKSAIDERKAIQGKMLDKEDFAMAALESISTASVLGQELDMTFLDLQGANELKGKLGGDSWEQFKDQLSGLLKGASVDGQSASELEDGRFGLVHEKGMDLDALKNKIQDASRSNDPEGKGIEIDSQTIDAEPEGLNEREFAKALVYTISKFAENGNDLTLGSINDGFEDFLKENAVRITELKHLINQHRCDLVFQPIVSLVTNTAHHYEVLARFEANKSPYELVTFSEDIGLVCDLDMMVCTKAMNYVLYNLKENKDVNLAVNISGVSIQNDTFIKTLRERFKPHLGRDNISKRISFEITESSEIRDLDKVNHYIKELKKDGFELWLDDFGSGAASFQYLQKLEVNGVKIDGQYVDHVIESDRDGKLIKNLVSLCKDLGMKTVAERIETVEQARFLKSIQVDYGQGYLFARPMPRPEYSSKAKIL